MSAGYDPFSEARVDEYVAARERAECARLRLQQRQIAEEFWSQRVVRHVVVGALPRWQFWKRWQRWLVIDVEKMVVVTRHYTDYNAQLQCDALLDAGLRVCVRYV